MQQQQPVVQHQQTQRMDEAGFVFLCYNCRHPCYRTPVKRTKKKTDVPTSSKVAVKCLCTGHLANPCRACVDCSPLGHQLCQCKTQLREGRTSCPACNMPFCTTCPCVSDILNSIWSHEWWDFNKSSTLSYEQQSAEKRTQAAHRESSEPALKTTGSNSPVQSMPPTLGYPTCVSPIVEPSPKRSRTSYAVVPEDPSAFLPEFKQFISTSLLPVCGSEAEPLALVMFDVLQAYEQAKLLKRSPQELHTSLLFIMAKYYELSGKALAKLGHAQAHGTPQWNPNSNQCYTPQHAQPQSPATHSPSRSPTDYDLPSPQQQTSASNAPTTSATTSTTPTQPSAHNLTPSSSEERS